MINPVAEIAAAEAAGLSVRVSGADLLVAGLLDLPVTEAQHWRERLLAAKPAIVAALRGPAPGAAASLRHFGVEVVYLTSARIAGELAARIAADVGAGLVGFDLETMPLPSEAERRREREAEIVSLTGRVQGYRRAGKPAKALATAQELKFAREAAKHAAEAALDPNRGTPRLVQVYPGGDKAYVFDMRRIPWAALAPLWDLHLVAHNAAFELKYLAIHGILPTHPIECTMQMSGMLLGSRRRSLEVASAEYLGLPISKEEQTSDWSASKLTPAQLDYAALDAVLVLKLAEKMLPALGTTRTAYLLQRDAQAVTAEMERHGVLLDVEALNGLIAALHEERNALADAYRGACLALQRPDLAARGIPSAPEEKRALLTTLLTEDERRDWKKTPSGGRLSVAKSELHRGAHYPPIARLADVSAIDKFLSSFGPGLIAEVSPVSGRLHPSIIVAGARSGRATYSNPPLQQIPKDKRYRRLIIAAPGYVLVGADYAIMELRAAAWVSNDSVMLAAFADEVDLHTLTATTITGKPFDEITPEDRDNAKRVNFGAAYGMGADALVQAAWDDYNKVITPAEAAGWLSAFKTKFFRFAAWCREHAQLCADRGHIIIGRDARQGQGRIHRFSWNRKIGQKTYTQSCNLPIQGQCADASMLALIKTERALRNAGIDGRIVVWIHDEIVIEVPAADAERARDILECEMTAAFAEIFPGASLKDLVKAQIGSDWAATKEKLK